MKSKIQIFVSYARKDKEQVLLLYDRLKEEGYNPWIDLKDILGGEKWFHAIKRAITRADFFLVCLSVNSINKRGVIQKEILEALEIQKGLLDRDIYIIPVRLEKCKIPERLEMFNCVDLFEDNGFQNLLRILNARLLVKYKNFFENGKLQQYDHIKRKVNPFEISLKEFLNLPENEMDKIFSIAGEINSNLLKKYFTEYPDVDWVVISKGPGNIIKKGKIEDELHEVDILKLAEKVNAPVFIYSRPKETIGIADTAWFKSNFKSEAEIRDTTWSSKRSSTNPGDYYPTVLLEFNTKKGKQIVKADFDTGSFFSFISYEELREKEIIERKIWSIGSSILWGSKYQYYNVTIICYLVGKSSKQEIRLKCKAVKNWDKSPLCRNYRNRTGLIGREVLLDNNLKLILDGENKETDILSI